MTENLINRISFYLASGGLFNPELADHIAVRTLLFECREALAQTEQAQQAEPVAWSHAGAMPPDQEAMKEAAYQLAPWLSAALDDPKVCKEYKDVINAWFDAAMPAPHRTWIGLTIKEYQQAVEGLEDLEDCWIAIQAKLKEKNG